MLTIALCLAGALLLWFLQGQQSSIRRNGKRLPRPPGTLPFAGNGIWFLQPRHKLLNWFVQCERQTGFDTFEISVPSLPPAIVINDPTNVEHVLKNNDIFIKGSFFRARSWDLFGNGIINADGELWKIQRKAGLRFFSNANLKQLIDEILPPILADTNRTLYDAVENKSVIDLQAILLELTTRLMGNMAYDMDMPSSLSFSKSFDFASGKIGERFQNPFWKLSELLFGSSLRNAVFEVKQFGTLIVAAAVSRRATSAAAATAKETADPLKNNLINALLDHIDDHTVVADAAMNYLSAGRDTTAQSMTWTFYLLMRHPESCQTIIDESKKILEGGNRGLSLNFEDVQASVLPHTAAIFNEALRLYPPVPVEMKECTASSIFPDGTWVPKGAVVLWVTWALGRSHKIWGNNADEFRPERWLEVDGSGKATNVKNVSAYEWPVFNGGPRSCLGKRMAELLAVYVIADLTWRYEFEEISEKHLSNGQSLGERQSQNSLTLPMEGGLPCCVHLRKK